MILEKKAVVAYYEVFRHLPGRTEENREEPLRVGIVTPDVPNTRHDCYSLHLFVKSKTYKLNFVVLLDLI
jgi:hypothetical protein